MGHSQSLHPILHLADRGVDRHQRKADPAGHLRNTHGNGPRSSNAARCGQPVLPQQNGATDQDHRQNPRQRHQRQSEPRGDDAVFQRPIAKHLHRLQRNPVLKRGMGEKLDRFDVGDGVHHLPRHHGPTAGARRRIGPHHRDEDLDEQEIGQKPDRQSQANPQIDRKQKHHRGDHRRQSKGHGVDHFGRDIRHRPRRLHLLLCNPPSEIIVEKRQRLAQRPAVQPA